MSTETQRIIRWIPIANFIPMFCWIIYCLKHNVGIKHCIKRIIAVFVWLLIVFVPCAVLIAVSRNPVGTYQYISPFMTYLIMLGVSTIAIRAQESLNAGTKDE
ncbi:MAG: hypothetical protein IJD10_04830 [Clostridia bacterium]|nr:hypothetical protein [Clostridia bacterium]